ncbi:MAG: amidohydrolase [Bryobacterales bacterium]|nr:amidohydrolase [Bryobacterales bacterium]
MRTLFLLVFCVLAAAQEPATVIIRNARVWTANPGQPWAEAVAIRGEKIAAAGGDSAIAKLAGPATKVIDAQGRLVTPGFIDAHIHLSSGALGLSEIDLTGVCSLPAMQQRIAQWAAANPDEPWVVGRGWEYNCFPGKRLPTREDLDAAVKDRPAYLRAYDGHTTWVNSKALQMASVTKDTKFDGFGELVRDSAGEPTGCLKEGAAALVGRLLPATTPERRLAALRQGLKLAASLGITSIQNASGSRGELALYEKLLAAGELTLRVDLAMSTSRTADPCSGFADLIAKYKGDRLRVAMVKFLVDGVIESHTAAMIEPYSDGNSTTGQLSWDPDVYRRAVKACHDAGFQVETHAIGDRGIRLALDAYSALPATARARVEHIESVHPADIARFAKLGVIASMMPIHADPGSVDVWSRAVGSQRLPYSFAWRSLQNAGARLAFSSDWPASISVDPIRGIHNAVNRQSIDGTPKGGWLPGERVPVETALRAYTTDAAYAAFEESARGSIAPGQAADLVILSADLFRIPAADIHKTRVATTIFNGAVVYQRD